MGTDKIVTHYDNLKVARNAPPEVIRAAYRVLAQQFHPDKYPDRALAEHRMKVINAAYEVLSDPVRRREHDAWIAEQEVGVSRTTVKRSSEGASYTSRGVRLITVCVPDIGHFKNIPVIEVLVKPGDSVGKETPLITLESDKATMEVPSPVAGRVKELKVKIGDKVSEGSLILTLESGDATSRATSRKTSTDHLEEAFRRSARSAENTSYAHVQASSGKQESRKLVIISVIVSILVFSVAFTLDKDLLDSRPSAKTAASRNDLTGQSNAASGSTNRPVLSFDEASRCFWVYAPIVQVGRDFPHDELYKFGQVRMRWYDSFIKANKGNPALKREFERGIERHKQAGLQLQDTLHKALSTRNGKSFSSVIDAAETCDRILGISAQSRPRM